ncbi:hypothetical protein CXB51_029901 [Gossypium anomalum]|uniref:Aminotransferase-like plant mobile domain-containing protein n=1 Tax=Gossypium anomalum TaxID=47600 RepID=A0A8J6CQ60_9ROSI|nr:hypothetical protein CXB51_029901 [Gossypium anomalum]
MAGKLIRLDHKYISVEQMKMITCVNREVETEDAHISSSIRRVYYHFGGRPVTIRIASGWGHTHRLRDTFPELGNDSTEVERIRYARAYILEMIGDYPMLNLSRNLVYLRWLLKLVDFRVTGKLSWESTMLATLYREMCGATLPNKAKIEGCLSRLQSWARFRFPFLRPRVNHIYTFPFIMRWNYLVSYVGIPTTLEDIRLLLNQLLETQFQWTPYEDPAIRAVIPEELFQNPNIWHVKVPLVNYAIVEIQLMDRVL